MLWKKRIAMKHVKLLNLLVMIIFVEMVISVCFYFMPVKSAKEVIPTNEKKGIFLCGSSELEEDWTVIHQRSLGVLKNYAKEHEIVDGEMVELEGNTPNQSLDGELLFPGMNLFIIRGYVPKGHPGVIHVNSWEIVKPINRGNSILNDIPLFKERLSRAEFRR